MILNLFGLSGGKDSTRLVAWAIHESGYARESLIFTFCDTENEYEEVYQQIRDLDAYVQKYGCRPMVYLRASGKWVDEFWMFPLFLALAVWKGRFPSAKARFCTEALKIKPTEKFVAELISSGQPEGFHGPPFVVSHSGVRAAESIERSMMEEWATDMFGCRTRRPLLKLTLEDVWRGHIKYGLPINPLYREGWKRVGCRLCVMSTKSDIRRTARKRPWIIDLYSTWEKIATSCHKKTSIFNFSSFFHRKTVPLSQRSKMVQCKEGPMMIATMEDVARWSLTTRGGKDQAFDFFFEEESFNIDDAHAPCKSGFCE